MGICGGISAITCQLAPIHILDISENFQCVPIIFSILYGKRRAGIVSIIILSIFQIVMREPSSTLVAGVLAIFVYSAIPMMVCIKFDKYNKRYRIFVSILLSIVITFIELLFILIDFILNYGGYGIGKLASYYSPLCIACFIQIALMAIASFLLENINENIRIRNVHESLIKYNHMGIAAFDMNHRFTMVNESYEEMFGYKESELLRKSRLHLWYEEDHGLANELWNSVISGEVNHNVEAIIRHKNGHGVAIRATMLPIKEHGTVIGYFALVTNVTESKIAEEALRNADKLSAIGQLAAGIGHEIRNPLTALKGFLQLIPSTKDPGQFIDIMQDELTRIELIVSELLVLAKPQATEFSVRDIRNKLTDVLRLLNAQAAMKSINIVTRFEDSVPKIQCEPNQLKQVFINIVKNAIEATCSSGTVTIELQSLNNDHIVVRISDTGPGIPKETLSRLGDPFFTTKETGTGLGLLMSKRIVSNHHGNFEITSEVGHGTTVSIALPYKQPKKHVTVEQISAKELVAATSQPS